MPKAFKIFLIFFVSFSLFLASAKLAVDGCLPERGSRLFNINFTKDNPICNQLFSIDGPARRELAAGGGSAATWLHKKDYEADSPLINGGARLLIYPTIVLAEVPENIWPLLASGISIFVFSLFLAFLYYALSEMRDSIASEKAAEPRKKTEKKNFERPQKR